jgi:hypothetical protein
MGQIKVDLYDLILLSRHNLNPTQIIKLLMYGVLYLYMLWNNPNPIREYKFQSNWKIYMLIMSSPL